VEEGGGQERATMGFRGGGSTGVDGHRRYRVFVRRRV
jgi:hypothetical protein